MTRKSPKRRNQAAAGAAILCVLLGAGNLIFAGRAMESLNNVLEKAKVELQQKESQQKTKGSSLKALKQPGRFLPDLNVEKQARYITRLQKRIEFYEFVRFGGRIFLGASGVLALMAVLFFWKAPYPGDPPV